MKKRLISIILVAVMLVATIPAFSASAATVDSYRTTLTSKNIAVDGVLDEAYKTSQKITSSFWGTGNSSNLSFEAYTAVTLRGVYVWAEIKDNSLVKSASHPAGEGDKFQIYIRMSNGTDDVWGWYDTDYNGNISKAVKAGSLGTPTYATTKIYDGSGWRSEIFIPFEGSLTIENVSAAKIYIGLQANNATYTNGATSNTAYCYDKDARSPYYYNGNDLYSPLNLISTGDVPSDVGGKSAVYVKGSSPTIDGTKDASYSEHAKIALGYVIKDSAYTGADTRSDLGHVYLSFDNYYLYIYYETVDTDLNSNDYFQVYYHFNNNGSPTAGYFCSKIDPTGSIYYGSTGSSYGYPGTALSAPTATGQFRAVGKSLGNNKYALEYRIPLPTGERSAISANG